MEITFDLHMKLWRDRTNGLPKNEDILKFSMREIFPGQRVKRLKQRTGLVILDILVVGIRSPKVNMADGMKFRISCFLLNSRGISPDSARRLVLGLDLNAPRQILREVV
ncbi:hypothetical protein ABEB36_009636 [Hypothenemus hampei]|uniref:Uncharacterized protein n=1 Tax=Hypothenemus hampei TaxID=57062 RepID=A0ABD1EHK6_HYPHA